MKDCRDPPVGSTWGPQASAASRPRAPAAPACRGSSAALLPYSGDASGAAATATNYSAFAAPAAGRGGAAAKNSARGRDRSPPLVTRSATAQRPPGVIITKQMLVRLKPCTADRSGSDSSSSRGLGSSSSSSGSGRDDAASNAGKESSGRRHNSGGGSSSSCVAGRTSRAVASACSEQTDSQHEAAFVSAERLKTRGEASSSSDITITDKTSAAAPTAAGASRLSADTHTAATCNTMKTCEVATPDAVARQRPQALPGRINSRGESRKKVQEAEAVGNSAATADAVRRTSTKEHRLSSKAAATQEHVQQHVQAQSECPPPPLQQQTREHGLQQQQAVQQQVLTKETQSTKKEQAEGPKADAASKAKPKTKVVVRLLPPSVTEEELLGLVPEELKKQITWRKFYPGSHFTQATGDGGCTSKTSVWFLNCTSPAAAEVLIRTFQNKCFVDERHTTFKAIAGLAPYQKTPRKKATEKRLEGQIEDEPLYASFLESLKDGGSGDANSTAHAEMEQLEILRDDEGTPITAMLLEMREKYNVKTTVNGRLYTLAMLRDNVSLSQAESTHG